MRPLERLVRQPPVLLRQKRGPGLLFHIGLDGGEPRLLGTERRFVRGGVRRLLQGPRQLPPHVELRARRGRRFVPQLLEPRPLGRRACWHIGEEAAHRRIGRVQLGRGHSTPPPRVLRRAVSGAHDLRARAVPVAVRLVAHEGPPALPMVRRAGLPRRPRAFARRRGRLVGRPLPHVPHRVVQAIAVGPVGPHGGGAVVPVGRGGVGVVREGVPLEGVGAEVEVLVAVPPWVPLLVEPSPRGKLPFGIRGQAFSPPAAVRVHVPPREVRRRIVPAPLPRGGGALRLRPACAANHDPPL
mmetsp:Transcript_12470/g.39457  ORF Transcript_12470/g.39457 Transcript_12470/m.39457 type:complete len:298 (-) Transcript_12470:314-1207(-)